MEYWTEPARFFRGKVTGNNFHIISTSRRKWIKPSVEGTVTEAAEGSLITIKISPAGLGRLLLYLVAIMILLMALGVFRNGQIWIVGVVALIALTASAATYPGSCWSAKIRLEEIFQAKGEKQSSQS